MFIDKELAKVIKDREARRPEMIARYQQGLAEGRYGPLYLKRKKAEEDARRAGAVPTNVDPKTGEITENPDDPT